MRTKKVLPYLFITVGLLAMSWILLTIWVEQEGPPKKWEFGNNASPKAIVIFDPDPFYNLDEQACLSFAKSLSKNRIHVTVTTVAAAKNLQPKDYDLVMLCANTYNWRPDHAIIKFIEENERLISNMPIVAITLGAGSTSASQKAFEEKIKAHHGTILESNSLWLWRPNDKTRMQKPNVEVACDIADAWGHSIAKQFLQ